MGVLSIKIKIGDREYPMRVDAAEEENIRLAGRLLNENIKKYKDQFGIDDKQDLLAMVAFDSMIEKLKTDAISSGQSETIFSRISHLEQVVSDNLSSE